ncbi:MAG TPA: hypothetical protein VMV80_03535 [Anaerolineales bacterium]|nr:hypothetical protein [Anaerolineales bacterium]
MTKKITKYTLPGGVGKGYLTREGPAAGWKPPQTYFAECRPDQMPKKWQT